jgi:hypothetical protein
MHCQEKDQVSNPTAVVLVLDKWRLQESRSFGSSASPQINPKVSARTPRFMNSQQITAMRRTARARHFRGLNHGSIPLSLGYFLCRGSVLPDNIIGSFARLYIYTMVLSPPPRHPTMRAPVYQRYPSICTQGLTPTHTAVAT